MDVYKAAVCKVDVASCTLTLSETPSLTSNNARGVAGGAWRAWVWMWVWVLAHSPVSGLLWRFLPGYGKVRVLKECTHTVHDSHAQPGENAYNFI